MKKILIIVVGGLILSCSGKDSLPTDLKNKIGDPAYANSKGELIIGFTIDPDGRGMIYEAVYEGDNIPEYFYDH